MEITLEFRRRIYSDELNKVQGTDSKTSDENDYYYSLYLSPMYYTNSVIT